MEMEMEMERLQNHSEEEGEEKQGEEYDEEEEDEKDDQVYPAHDCRPRPVLEIDRSGSRYSESNMVLLHLARAIDRFFFRAKEHEHTLPRRVTIFPSLADSSCVCEQNTRISCNSSGTRTGTNDRPTSPLPTNQLDYTVKVVTEEEPTTLYTVHVYACTPSHIYTNTLRARTHTLCVAFLAVEFRLQSRVSVRISLSFRLTTAASLVRSRRSTATEIYRARCCDEHGGRVESFKGSRKFSSGKTST